MKVILYLAITASGLVAREDGDTSWTSDLNWKQLEKLSAKTGNIIVGRVTYERLLKDGRFPLPARLNVVMTKNPPEHTRDNVLFTTKSPQDVLRELEEREFDTALVGGGGKLAGSFMKEKLIDELYLTVEPVVFGEGINIFRDADFHADLDLLETKKLSEHEIQLHYRVVK